MHLITRRAAVIAAALTLALGATSAPAFAGNPADNLATETGRAPYFAKVATAQPPVAVAPVKGDRAWVLERDPKTGEYIIQHVGKSAEPPIAAPGFNAEDGQPAIAANRDGVWVAGNGALRVWNGSKWSDVELPPASADIKAHSVLSLAADGQGRIHANVLFKQGDKYASAVHRWDVKGWTAIEPISFDPAAKHGGVIHFEGPLLTGNVMWSEYVNHYHDGRLFTSTGWTTYAGLGFLARPGIGYYARAAMLPPYKGEFIYQRLEVGDQNATTSIRTVTGTEKPCPKMLLNPTPQSYQIDRGMLVLADGRVISTGFGNPATYAMRAQADQEDHPVAGEKLNGIDLSAAPNSTTVWAVGSDADGIRAVARASFGPALPKK